MAVENKKTIPVVNEDTLEITLMELPMVEETKKSSDKSDDMYSMETVVDDMIVTMADSSSSTTDIQTATTAITQALPKGWTAENLSQVFHEYKVAEQRFKTAMEEYKANLLRLYDYDVETDKPTEVELPKNIIIGHLKTTYVKASTRTTIDTKKLQEEEPELAKKYMKITKVSPTIKTEWLDWRYDHV